MKSTLINLIAALVKRLVGEDLWTAIEIAVNYQDTENKTGEEKRAFIIEQAKELFSSATTWMLGLAIEAAVAKLKVSK